MIKIEKIEIENFRSFKEKYHTKNLQGCLAANIITGRNNVGKTNILRAIYLFFNITEYNPNIDMNYIKKITLGASKHPIIALHFVDDELVANRTIKYIIKCDFNKINEHKSKSSPYTCYSKDTYFKTKIRTSKLKDSASIEKYLDSKFKCVYISTTDEIITYQANKALNDMIIEYYKKRNKEVRESIIQFVDAHSNLLSTFEQNINFLQEEMETVFKSLNSGGFNISPKLELNSDLEITDFLIENLELKIDDDYIQGINSKGAGIQRASIILLNLFLLKHIYSKKSKIILLDEPEVYLYPLLVEKIKMELDNHLNDPSFQLFITTHSSSFLKEMNNELTYKYYNVEQEKFEREYKRSKNALDINKYSIVNQYDRKTRNEILRNYGLIDSIDDYEDIIIVEGETDKNYLNHIMSDLSFVPQIKYAKDYKYYQHIGKGAASTLNILSFLDDISDVKRKILVILDGDNEGQSVQKKISSKTYKNIEIKVKLLDKPKVIEDYVYTRDSILNKLKKVEPEFNKVHNMNQLIKNTGYDSVITLLENTIKLHSLNTDINKVKINLSRDLASDEINKDWILQEIIDFFEIES